jgi:anti-anti-sigma regulatory factor
MSNLSLAELWNVEPVCDGVLVHFHGRGLNEANARELSAELFQLAMQGSGPHLYLDLEEVETVPRQVLMRFSVLDRKLQDLGDRLILLNPRSRVREAVQLSHLSQVLKLRVRGE